MSLLAEAGWFLAQRTSEQAKVERREGHAMASVLAKLPKVPGHHEDVRRAASGNALRAAVMGANDGLVSNLSLVMGVAGAAMSGGHIVIAGVAGLLAGASSMALGEWISVQSSREMYAHEIEKERRALQESPAEEQSELAEVYAARGLPRADAERVASALMADPELALETHVREELAIDPRELGGSAVQAAIVSFLLFAVGAIVPVVPFIFLDANAILWSVLASAVGLLALGIGISRFTHRGWLRTGLRQLGFGLGAAALTFAIGRLLGVAVSG